MCQEHHSGYNSLANARAEEGVAVAKAGARLDVFLVEIGLAPSRSKAKALIDGGCVSVNGAICTKANQKVAPDASVCVEDATLLRYVSRGGLKLEQAIRDFNLDLQGKRVLDIGSSTGGFTDCALQHGAASVVSVDVGTDCMDPELAKDPRISLFEQTDIRTAPDECFQGIDLVVCDASFVSLPIVLEPALRIDGSFQIAALIKPQFEVGAEVARKRRGIINDPKIHRQVLDSVLQKLSDLGLVARELTCSPISGGDGNREYLVLLEPVAKGDAAGEIAGAFADGAGNEAARTGDAGGNAGATNAADAGGNAGATSAAAEQLAEQRVAVDSQKVREVIDRAFAEVS